MPPKKSGSKQPFKAPKRVMEAAIAAVPPVPVGKKASATPADKKKAAPRKRPRTTDEGTDAEATAVFPNLHPPDEFGMCSYGCTISEHAAAAPTPTMESLDAIKDIGTLQAPPLPRAKSPSEYYDRAESLKDAGEYVSWVIKLRVTDTGEMINSETQRTVEKIPLLGTSGVKGIGKTQFLLQLAEKLPKIAEELKVKACPIYISFSGGRFSNTVAFGKFSAEHRTSNMPEAELCSLAGHAFAYVLLTNCGAKVSVKNTVELDAAIDKVRSAVGLGPKDVLALLIDEIADLGDAGALQVIQALMNAVDAAQGTLVCVFSYIDQQVLDQGAELSGRKVLPLALPALPINIWTKLDIKGLEESVTSQPSLQQLVLSLAGHPRSIFEGLPEAIRKTPTLLSHPNPASITTARNTIIIESKFNSVTTKRMREVVPKWLEEESLDEQELIRDGLLHRVQSHPKIKFLLPLIVQQWAARCESDRGSRLAFHLKQLYDHDAILQDNTEKYMEEVMYHFEAAKRIAIGDQKAFTLGQYYKTEHIDVSLAARKVQCRVFSTSVSNVYKADSFAEQNMKEVLTLLNQGCIVASGKRTEVGAEYLVPFHDDESGKLLVACVQCKYARETTSWKTINERLEQATTYFETNGVEFFPVVYTTANQATKWEETLKNAVYFVEKDLFHFTNRLGILRLHCMQLGSVLKNEYAIPG